MSKLLIERLHPLLEQLLECQKSKFSVSNTLSLIEELLDGELSSPSCSNDDWTTCVAVALRAFCATALKTLLQVGTGKSLVNDTWKKDRHAYAAAVHSCYRGVKAREYVSNLGSLLKFGHVSSLLSAFVSNIEGNSVTVLTVLEAVSDMCVIVKYNPALKREFASINNVALYGKIISVCLEVASDSDKDVNCREKALSIVGTLIDIVDNNATCLNVVLPGLTTALVNTACKSATGNLRIIVSSVKLLSRTVRSCMSDSSRYEDDETSLSKLNPPLRELYVQRDEKWRSITSANVVKMVEALCSTLTVHRDEEVQRALVEAVYTIRNECKETFKTSLDSYLLDLLITCDRPVSLCSGIIEKMRSENPAAFSLHMHGKLLQLSERLPLNVQGKRTGTDILLYQLSGVLSCLKEDLHHLASVRAPTLRSILSAIAVTLRVDERRLLVSRGASSDNPIDRANTLGYVLYGNSDFLKLLAFASEVDFGSIHPICEILAKHGGLEAVDLAFSEMVESNKSDRASLAVLITVILDQLESDTESYTILALEETCIDWLKELQSTAHSRDDIIEHEISVPNIETVDKICFVLLAAVAFTRISERRTRLKILVVLLYELLELFETSHWVVHDAIDCALGYIAKAMNRSVSELLYEHGSYLVHQVAVAVRSRSRQDHAPIVVSALLDKVEDPRLYDNVRLIVEDLLLALDTYMQDYCILILRALLSFVVAVGRWFPTLKPSEEDDAASPDESLLTEEQAVMESPVKPLPQPIASVEHVLLRTKHLLSSPHRPIRLLAMRILRNGLHCLRNFDDSLLPMVHQNWEALINRFSDAELEVREEAVKVVVQMVEVSKTFVNRRVRLQLWPILEKWVTRDRYHAYPKGSLAWKLQLLVTESVAGIYIGIDAAPSDVEKVMAILSLIEQQSTSLHMKAEAGLAHKQLEDFLKEKKGAAGQSTS